MMLKVWVSFISTFMSSRLFKSHEESILLLVKGYSFISVSKMLDFISEATLLLSELNLIKSSRLSLIFLL